MTSPAQHAATPYTAKKSMLSLALPLLFLLTAATPTADFGAGNNRVTYVAGVDFALSFGLTYPADPNLEFQNSTLFMKVLYKAELLSESNMPLFADGVLQTAASISPLAFPSSGDNQEMNVILSYDADFAEATENVFTGKVVKGWITIWPPLVTIIIAVATREVELEFQNSTLFMKVLYNAEVLAKSKMPIFVDGVLQTSTAISPLAFPSSGDNQEMNVILSYDADFAQATENVFSGKVVKGWITIWPPLVTIIIAVATREVLWALWAGVWTATMIIYNGNVLTAFLRTLDTYIVGALGNIDHAYVILFSWFLSGLIAVVTKSGGAHGFADLIVKKIRSRRGAELAIFFLGFLIFFDDYANTLILGGTMRPIADLYFVARERLAMLIDCTTAPIASIAPISSWIGFELGLIQDAISALQAEGFNPPSSAYDVFIQTIPSRYYPWFMLVMQFVLVLGMRAMGPMLEAARRAQYKRELNPPGARLSEVEIDKTLEPEADTPRRWWNGAVPILVTLVAVLLGLMLTGYYSAKDAGMDITAANIFGEGDSYGSILWGAFFGSMVIWVMTALQYKQGGKIVNQWKYWIKLQSVPVDENGEEAVPLLSPKESLASWIEGVKGMTVPVLVLIMAWSLGAAVVDCGADAFFSSVLTSDSLDPRALPVLTFLIAALISFATGSSWGTMSIVFPLAAKGSFIAGGNEIFVLTVSAILSGAVFGDHATAISDTTILSAMSAKCSLNAHVITQLPFALVVGTIAALVGYIPAGYGMEGWAALLVGIVVVCLFTLAFCVRVDHPASRQDFWTITGEFIRTKIFRREPSEFTQVPESKREYCDVWTRNFWTMETFTTCCSQSDDLDAGLEDDEEAIAAKLAPLNESEPSDDKLEDTTSSSSGDQAGLQFDVLRAVDHPASRQDFWTMTGEFIRTKILRRDPSEFTQVPESNREYCDVWTRNFWTMETFTTCCSQSDDLDAGLDDDEEAIAAKLAALNESEPSDGKLEDMTSSSSGGQAGFQVDDSEMREVPL
eukprot:CAMPEP_0174913898 /NCGR_PEP_ID=MMETSP0167-20121228/80558_1 /TAXON_ID=38298 /ORGANISM="Rhodella maculata, Strain CCMP736" /LENGTH=1017 /DNA_ID=CAMNT_0016158637 /DNA_START=371 /DNA_END=3426 /DNA_ORIENTATION=+